MAEKNIIMKPTCGAIDKKTGIECQCEQGHAGEHWGTLAKTWGSKTRKGTGGWSNV